MKEMPIGYYFDKSLWEPGRYFDKLVRDGKRGLFIKKTEYHYSVFLYERLS